MGPWGTTGHVSLLGRSRLAAVAAVLLLGLCLCGCDAPRPSGEVASSTPAAPPIPIATKPVDPLKPGPTAQIYEHQGVRVAFELLPARGNASGAEMLREGQDALFRFTITDVSSGAGVVKTHPAAWLALQAKGEQRDALGAAKTIARFLRGDRFNRPMLDLNVFYALTMNDDATVTVVNPLFGFGNTKLLAMITLKSDAVDWCFPMTSCDCISRPHHPIGSP